MRSRDMNNIYFLDRSRCRKLKMSKILDGLTDSRDASPKVRLRTYGGACWSWPADGLTGRGGAEISEIEKAHECKSGERPDVRHCHFFW